MRITIDRTGKEATESFNLEAEVEAWRSERSQRPVPMTGKVPVVRVRRRACPSSLSDPPADRARSVTTAWWL